MEDHPVFVLPDLHGEFCTVSRRPWMLGLRQRGMLQCLRSQWLSFAELLVHDAGGMRQQTQAVGEKAGARGAGGGQVTAFSSPNGRLPGRRMAAIKPSDRPSTIISGRQHVEPA
jgi:hypothetical protein